MRIGKIAVVLCLLITAACSSVKTIVPIGTTVGLTQDKALLGTWKGRFTDDADRKNKGDSFVHFVRSTDTAITVIWVSAPVNGDDYGDNQEFTITTAKLGANHYFNAVSGHHTADDETVSEYIPVYYRLSAGNRLTIYLMDLNKTVEAIKAGAIAGSFSTTVNKDSNGTVLSHYDYASIEAEPAALDAFMAKPEATDLFKPYMVLKKIE